MRKSGKSEASGGWESKELKLQFFEKARYYIWSTLEIEKFPLLLEIFSFLGLEGGKSLISPNKEEPGTDFLGWRALIELYKEEGIPIPLTLKSTTQKQPREFTVSFPVLVSSS